jgi:carbamoyl-phosphate synthase large subunit
MKSASPGRVMVTGVGGAPGFDLAVSLLRRGIEVAGLDADPLAPGLLIPGIIPRVTASADSPGYPAALLGLCRELRPAALFCAVEDELPALIRMRHDLAALGVRTWLPDEHGVAVLVKIYAHCIGGQADAANQRITDALGTAEPEPGPGDEGDDDSKPAA